MNYSVNEADENLAAAAVATTNQSSDENESKSTLTKAF